MPIYKQTTEITNIDDLLSSVERDIEEVYFGDKNVFTVWAKYDGTLPAQYTADGDYLTDYRIYGASGGVGDRTGNIYETDSDAPKGYYNSDGTFIPNNSYESSKKISCNANDVLTVSVLSTMTAEYVIQIAFLNSEQSFILIHQFTESGTGEKVHSVIAPSNTEYVFIVLISNFANKMLVKGFTAPAEYVPYGYEVNMSVSDGTTSTTTPIYIGPDPLGEDERIDYDSGKIYRKTGNLIAPEDPPVPLPQLPTFDGVNIVDYAGQSAAVPSRFVAKYRKEGF